LMKQFPIALPCFRSIALIRSYSSWSNLTITLSQGQSVSPWKIDILGFGKSVQATIKFVGRLRSFACVGDYFALRLFQRKFQILD